MQDKAPAVQEHQRVVVGEDIVVEEPSQGEEAMALQEDGNIDSGSHRPRPRMEESVYSDAVPGHNHPHRGHVHALLRSLA